jgi:hypothetical protein
MEAVQTKLAIGNTVIGTYTAYTPSFTNLNVGNGTLAAQFCRVNNLIHAFGSLTFGSTTTITTFPIMTLPVNTSSTEMGTLGMVLGPVLYYDASAFAFFRGTLNGRTATGNADLRVNNVSGTYETNDSPSSLIPFTWTTSDVIRWNITYKAA